MKKNYLIYFTRAYVALLFLSSTAFAQDLHFSQFSETPAIINPALAGVRYNTSFTANYKDQWGSVGSKFQTFGLSFEQTIKFRKLRSSYFAISANIFRDAAGDAKLNTLNPNLGFSYIQRINRYMKFSGGVQSGFYYRTIDVDNLRWGKQYNGSSFDSNLPSGENTPRSAITAFDLGGGVNFSYAQSDKFISSRNAAKFNVGASAYHYSIGRNSFLNSTEKLQTKICAYFNGDFNIPGSKNAIMPSLLYMRQGPSTQFILGALIKFIIVDQSTYTGVKKPMALAIGGYYRYKDAIVPAFLLQVDKYAFGVSYDINVSSLTPASNRRGGLEIMLRYNVFPSYGRNLGRSDTRPSY
jgi:type IX secretion system PorP/SprF family membrane protein